MSLGNKHGKEVSHVRIRIFRMEEDVYSVMVRRERAGSPNLRLSQHVPFAAVKETVQRLSRELLTEQSRRLEDSQ